MRKEIAGTRSRRENLFQPETKQIKVVVPWKIFLKILFFKKVT